jgi:hypothetical protein
MAKLRVKPGVQPRLVDLIVAVGNVTASWTLTDELWITSAMDSIHAPNSLHYALRAVDIRTKNLPNQAAIDELVKRLRLELGDSYDVIDEHDHIHVEFDPS